MRTEKDKIGGVIILNTTKNDLRNLFSKFKLFNYYEKNNLQSLNNINYKNINFLCVLYDDKDDLENYRIKSFINDIKERDSLVFYANLNNKQLNDVVRLCNEISKLLCINIDFKSVKGYEIIDFFVVEKEFVINIQEQYINLLNKYLAKITNLNQIVISITCGVDTKFETLLDFIDEIKKRISSNVDIVLGTELVKRSLGIDKVLVLFEGESEKNKKRKLLDERIRLLHKKFKNSGYMSIKSIENENDNGFYKSQILKFCNLDEISVSLFQKYLSVEYYKACKIIENFENKKFIKKIGACWWKILDRKEVLYNLTEIFKNKL